MAGMSDQMSTLFPAIIMLIVYLANSAGVAGHLTSLKTRPSQERMSNAATKPSRTISPPQSLKRWSDVSQRYVVIGAGLVGLYTAYLLLSTHKTVQVTLVEGR